MEERVVAARRGRGRQLVGLLALFLGLAGALFALFLFLRHEPTPDFQSLTVGEYDNDHWPANAWAIRDSQLLEERFAAKSSYAAQTGARVLAELNKLREAGKRPVVLHLCALARTQDGQVFVLPGDADPENANQWISLKDVLKRFAACPASSKLLILDIMRRNAGSRLGIYADDVAAATHDSLQAADLPFLVLCSCSSGQTAQVSQELGQSVFAYYLDQGLAGHADGYGPDGVRDDYIKVRELAEFVTVRVDRWAWLNRGVRQTPAVYGKGPDFVVLKRGSGAAEPAAETKPAAYPPWLRSQWAQRDKWQSALSKLGPSVLRSLEAELLRAEQRWRGGDDEERVRTRLLQAFTKAEADVNDVLRTPPPDLRSLRGIDAKNAATFAAELRKLLFQSDNPALKDEKDKMAKEEFDKAFKEAQAKLAKAPEEAARSIFDVAAASERLPQAHFLLLSQLLKGLEFKATAGKRPDTLYAEVLFLARIKALADRVQKSYFDWPAAEVHQALKATELAETVVAELVAAPALSPWIAKDLETADTLRRKAEQELFEGFPPWSGVEGRLRDAASRYRDVLLRMREVGAAQTEWHRALRVLVRLAPAMSAQRDDHGEEPIWDEAIRSAKQLGARLMTGAKSGPLEGVRLLRETLDDLEKVFAAKEAALEKALKAEDHGQLEALLTNPTLDAGRRAKLWEAGQTRSLALQAETGALDDADNQAPKPIEAAPLPADRDAAQREARRRNWRGREALGLLALAGLADKLDKQAVSALENQREESWRKFAVGINHLWPDEASAELKNPRTSLARADWLTRLLSPFDLAEVGLKPSNPALALHRQEMAALLSRLSARYRADAAAASPAFRAQYAALAESYDHEALRWR